MENLRLLAVVDRVVAWHNRHPLARRISAAQVHAIGYVALPFTAEAPAPAVPRPADAAAQAIAAAAAAAAAAPLPVLTEVAEAAAADTAHPGEASRLRERALARARELGPAAQAADNAAAFLATLSPAGLKPAFSEDFIDPLSPRQVARFAQKHGRLLARAPLDGPVREVLPDAAPRARRAAAGPARVPVSVYLLTAVIETDTRKSRVLLGLGPALLGRRIHSPSRLAALLALCAGAAGAPLWLLRPAAPLSASAGAAQGPAASSAAVPVPALTQAAAPASAAAPAAVPGEAAVAPAGEPQALPRAESVLADAGTAVSAEPPAAEAPPVDERRRRPVNVVPLLSEAAKEQARAERRALLEAAAPPAALEPAALPRPLEPAPEPAPESAPSPATARAPAPAAARNPGPEAAAPAAPPRAPAAVPLNGPVFAISTRPLRTRAEAEQVQAAMQSLLAAAAPAGLRVEVLPEGDDWRVVALPYMRAAEAERGRALLASRGMRVKVLDF